MAGLSLLVQHTYIVFTSIKKPLISTQPSGIIVCYLALSVNVKYNLLTSTLLDGSTSTTYHTLQIVRKLPGGGGGGGGEEIITDRILHYTVVVDSPVVTRSKELDYLIYTLTLEYLRTSLASSTRPYAISLLVSV